MYDIIGDIHGHADALEQLLRELGYHQAGGVYRHADRQIIFLGDFIDRGPKIRQVLEIVRPMVEQGHALAVMGNHELNALAFHTDHPQAQGTYLRPRSNKNIRQHAQTLLQLDNNELKSVLNWFRTLPMWLELEGLRAVHACWHQPAIDLVAQGLRHHGGITPEFLHSACCEGGDLFGPVEILLKGKEIRLPSGVYFHDKEGHQRHKIRTRWYLPAAGQTYGGYALQSDPVDCSEPLLAEIIQQATSYPLSEKPVFVGHYWLSSKQPELLAANIACLDFSVAKGGYLCAYRWNGEQQLSTENFVWVR
jgi:hypothetical protein